MAVGGTAFRRSLSIVGRYPASRDRQKPFSRRSLRALVDPNVAPVRALPRENRELFIAAHNGHMLAFDNLSNLPPWISDALCRLASGGGFAVRRLYSDQDEVLFEAARPIILNGIEDVITRPDFADRAIFLTLAADHGSATPSGERILAQVRDRTAAHPRCAARCGGTRLADASARSPATAAAHG